MLHEWHKLSCQELEALVAGVIIEEEVDTRQVLSGSGNVSLTWPIIRGKKLNGGPG